MYKATFKFGGDYLEAIYSQHGLMFNDVSSNTLTTIEGLRLNKHGVVKEFPDLEDDINWRSKAIQRFKEHINKMKNEEEVINYIIIELKKHGYEPLFTQRSGFRIKKIK